MVQLNEIEARIVGCLVEKSLTTPEQYPLSLNALLNACNQKTSREPVMTLDEAALGRGLFTLLEKGLAERVSEPGSRVPKFKHHVQALLGREDPKEVGLLCVLLLRGPQTPGELKTRTDRLCEFASTAEVEGLLQDLAARGDGPLVSRLARQPGQKESRYQHLFCGPAESALATAAAAAAPAGAAPTTDRLALLEKRVEVLEDIVKTLSKGGP